MSESGGGDGGEGGGNVRVRGKVRRGMRYTPRKIRFVIMVRKFEDFLVLSNSISVMSLSFSLCRGTGRFKGIKLVVVA